MRYLGKTTMLLALLAFTPACRDPSKIINLYGFTALRPPSNLYQAGAVVAVNYGDKDGSPQVESFKLLCGPRASLGPEWMPMESETLAGMQKIYSKQEFHLETSALDRIRSNQTFEDVTDIVVQLDNARIVEMADIDVWENIHNRSDACRKAIEARVNQGFDVTMISSNIIADIVYKVEFRRRHDIDKKAQVAQMRELAVSLGGGHTYVDESSIHAKNLAVGVKTDNYLLAVSMPSDIQEKIVHSPRHVSVDSADADVNADAPIVHPSASVMGTRKK